MTVQWRIMLCCSILGISAGCGGFGSQDAPARRIVEGMVTYGAVPLESGEIRFFPEPSGPVASAMIKDGKYRVTNKGGVPIGAVRVEITSAADTSKLSEDDILSGQDTSSVVTSSGVVIPARYNTETTLKDAIPRGYNPHIINYELTR
ncbi:MAG TPA: hypothetical protein VNQ76_03960 [Planctomicrobium sp.]|nr:hypothetical protein [Planctomicrobium sp.]